MPIKVSKSEMRELQGQASLDSMMAKLLEYQKNQDTSIEMAMQSINSSLDSLKSFERKVGDLSTKELDVNKELKALQQQIVNILTIVSSSVETLRQAKQKEDLALIQSLEKIVSNLDQKNITQSIDNLTNKIKSPEDYEWEFKVIRDQITGQMESVRAKPLK